MENAYTEPTQPEVPAQELADPEDGAPIIDLMDIVAPQNPDSGVEASPEPVADSPDPEEVLLAEAQSENPAVFCTAEEFAAFKQHCNELLHELQAKILAAEHARNELAVQLENLQQQFVDAGVLFVENSGVRLRLEEMITQMLDARLLPSQEGEASHGSRLDDLEQRIRAWEAEMDRHMMQAAARVIREEISAMRTQAESSHASKEPSGAPAADQPHP